MPAAPSLLIVPYRSKTGRLYSQIPVPVAPATTGAGDFTVTRDTTARRFNSAGLIESVASGIPRLDYYTSGGTAGCPALLVEPSGTNLALQSEAWNVSPWAATIGGQGATVSGNVTTSPDGTTNADKLIEAAVTGSHFCLQNLTLTSGTTYTASFFAKASERTLGRFRMNGASSYFDIDFNLTSGTVTGGTNPFIQNYGNGWYRIGGTFTANQASNNFILTLRDASGNTSYTGNGTNGFFVWGAQLETGSVATSYIPTAAASGSRSADVISVSGAVSGSIGQTAGTIYCEFAFLGTPTTRSGPIFLRQADSRGMSINFAPTDSPSGIRFSSRNNAGTTSLNIVSGALQVGTFYKVAIAYDAAGTAAGGTQASGVVAYVNGSQVAIGTFQVPDAAGLTQFRMYGANSGSDTEAFNGRIRSAALYTTKLNDAELATLTTP